MQPSKLSCKTTTSLILLRAVHALSSRKNGLNVINRTGLIITWILMCYSNEWGGLMRCIWFICNIYVCIYILPLLVLWHVAEFGEWFLNCIVWVSISSPECAGVWHWHISLSDLFENMSPSFKTCCYRNIPWWIRSLSLVWSDPIQCTEWCHICWHLELVERFEICLHRGWNTRL